MLIKMGGALQDGDGAVREGEALQTDEDREGRNAGFEEEERRDARPLC